MTTIAPARRLSFARTQALSWLGCAAFTLLALRGIWPIVPVEGDEQGVLFGVDGMVRSAPELLARRYAYEVQPGSYQALAAIVRWTGLSSEAAFAGTTVLGAAVFAAASAWLLASVLSIPFVFALLATLWCQETITAACYLNTSAFAGAVALLALVPFARNTGRAWLIAGGAGLGIAGWLRGDALLASPAAFALLVAHRGFGWAAVRDTVLAALTALVTFILLRELSGTPVQNGLATYATLSSEVATNRTTRDAVITMLSPALLVLAVAGYGWLAWRRDYARLFVAIAGVVPTLLAYRGALVSTKYLYYTIPFALVPALALLRAGAERIATARPRSRHLTITAAAALAAADLAGGVRLLPPEARYYESDPTLARARLNSAGIWAIALGTGDVIPDEDGFRLRGGHAFAPLVWHREKVRQAARLAQLRSAIDSTRTSAIFFAAWLPEQIVSRELFLAGFTPPSTPGETAWRNAERAIDVAFLGHVGSPFQPIARPPIGARDSYFVGIYGGKIPPTELTDFRRWRRISEPAEGFITLFRRE